MWRALNGPVTTVEIVQQASQSGVKGSHCGWKKTPGMETNHIVEHKLHGHWEESRYTEHGGLQVALGWPREAKSPPLSGGHLGIAEHDDKPAAESPGCLATEKMRKQGPPQGDLSSPSNGWSCTLDLLTFHIAGYVVQTFPNFSFPGMSLVTQ